MVVSSGSEIVVVVVIVVGGIVRVVVFTTLLMVVTDVEVTVFRGAVFVEGGRVIVAVIVFVDFGRATVQVTSRTPMYDVQKAVA